MRYAFFVLVVFLLAGFSGEFARGEFIFDGFDDPAETISPEMEGVGVVTENVGPLGAVRIIEIDAIGADPVGRLDSNITAPSRLTADLIDLAAFGTVPQAAMQLWYWDFGVVDFTEGGANDAFLFDFASLTGANPPAFLRQFIHDGSAGAFKSYVFDLPLSEEPFTVAIPFDTFVRRDGAPVEPSFSTINHVSVEFYSNGYWVSPVENGWTVSLDAIRVGRAVPEPHGFLLCGVAVTGLGVFLVFCRKRLRTTIN